MKKLNTSELRSVDGGASKYVQCPVCKHSYKTPFFQRLFASNDMVKRRLRDMHFKSTTGWNTSSSVH